MTSFSANLRRNWRHGVLPVLTILVIFLFLPVLIVFSYSFMTKGPFGGVVYTPSIEAYRNLLFSEDFDGSLAPNVGLLNILARSVALAACTTVICAVVGVPCGFFIATRSAKLKNALLIALMIPFWSNLLIRTVAIIILLRSSGPINEFLLALRLIDRPAELLYTRCAVVLGMVYVFLPFMVFPVFTAIERLDRRLVEASFDLYANRYQSFVKVILPVTMPGIAAGSLLVFLPAIGAYITPDLLGGGKQLMIGNLIALQFTDSRNWPYGAALSIVLLAVVMIALFLRSRLSSKQQTDLSRE